MTVSSLDCDGQFQFLDSAYVGINTEKILYGIELLLYFETMRALLSHKAARRKSIFYALFSSVMLFSITIWVAAEAIFGQKVWLLGTNSPEGPYVLWKTHISVWYMEWSRVQIILLQLITDALMIYRCRMIWNSNRVVTAPILLWIATLALGSLVAWINSIPGVTLSTGLSAHFSLAYWSTSVFLNAILTCMICYYVMRHGRRVKKHLGHEHAYVYFAIAGIVIESMLPYTLSGIIFLVTLGVGNQTYAVFLRVYVLMMCISPQMLILRVIAGQAWGCDTLHRSGSTIRFNPEVTDASGSGWSEGSGVPVDSDTSSNAHFPDSIGRVRILEV